MITAVRAFAIFALLALVLVTAVFVVADRRGGADIDVSVLNEAPIAVNIEGAVASPGVYQLPANARLNDAIAAAGGLTGDANTAGLNLAARIGDGERIVVPFHSSATAATVGPSPVASSLININTSTAAELDQLPGIGKVLAGRIVEYRDEHGPFTSIEQLAEIDGISEGTVDELRNLVTIDG